MRDVAARAGVSIKTVSRVVNQEAGVSHHLVGRVETAARELDYRPDITAISLRRGRHAAALGLMLEDVANPFSGSIHRAVDDAAGERGMAVLATSLDMDPARELEVVRTMIQHRVDGLIMMPTGPDQSYLAAEVETGMAVVFIDRPPIRLDADTVMATNRLGAREAVEHLLSVGHRRIAFLGDLPGISTASERHAGYVDALMTAGIPLDERLVRTGLHAREQAEQAVEGLLCLPPGVAPTALFASQNLISISAVRVLHRLSRQDRVAIVGFDDIELADALDPGITVVAQDPYAMGRAAAELLFARLEGDGGPSVHRTIATHLVVRGSGEIPAAAT